MASVTVSGILEMDANLVLSMKILSLLFSIFVPSVVLDGNNSGSEFLTVR